ncbi:MAG: carboxypeptidase-like regulatory domain-containing protein, partial [bacterium]
ELQRAAISGPDGAYRLAGIPAGTYAVHVRHVGDEPLTDSMRFAPSGRVTRSFTLRRATVLDTVRTSARAVSANLRVFEAHAATRMGAYVSDSALLLRSGRRLADVLPMLIQDLRIWRTGKQVYVVAPSRGRVLSGFRNASRCISTVYLNGELQWDIQQLGAVLPFSIADYSVDDIAGVEFYGGNAPVPTEFRRTKSECGTLALWTRS